MFYHSFTPIFKLLYSSTFYLGFSKIPINNHIYWKKTSFNILKCSNTYFSNVASNNSNKFRHNVEFDYDYLCNEANTHQIKENIIKRKCDGNIDKVVSLWKTLKHENLNADERAQLEEELYKESFQIPNKASPHLFALGDEPNIIKTVNSKSTFSFKPMEFHNLCKDFNIITLNKTLSLMGGSRSYVLNGPLANLERALIRYTVTVLIKKGFTLISVPDLLHSFIIERCGMETEGQRSQVYHLNNFENMDVCLSGTAEMAIGGYLQDKRLNLEELPLKFAAVSRCYRQEVGQESAERGIFRVHQFNKVEMYGVTADETGEESKKLHDEFVNIQTEIFEPLNFHFKVLDMPINELGNPAYIKTDIEAWIPGKLMFGEISSASNCLDYQSRRLNLKYKSPSGSFKFPHTINGTACATPRVLIATVSSNQLKRGVVAVPDVLQPFMNGQKFIGRSKPLDLKHFNHRSYDGSIVNVEDYLVEECG